MPPQLGKALSANTTSSCRGLLAKHPPRRANCIRRADTTERSSRVMVSSEKEKRKNTQRGLSYSPGLFYHEGDELPWRNQQICFIKMFLLSCDVSDVLVPVRIIFFQPAIALIWSTCYHKIRRCSQIGLEVSMRKTRHGGSRAQMLDPGWSFWCLTA